MENTFNLIENLRLRFPTAKFVPTMFNTMEEVENKILIRNIKEIIVCNKIYIDNIQHKDYYIIKSKDKHIYYKDVIEYLLNTDFRYKNYEHSYLEDFTRITTPKLSYQSVPLYEIIWSI